MDIPEEIRAKLMAQLGVSSDHINEALGLAQKSSNVGVTPFLQHMRQMTEYFKSFKNQTEKLEQFAKCRSSRERIDLVQKAVSKSEFKDVKKLFSKRNPKKDDKDQSKKYRDAGNKFYQHKRFPEALRSYTDSMIEVTIDEEGKSKEIALALGNRYTVYITHVHEVKIFSQRFLFSDRRYIFSWDTTHSVWRT